MVPGLGPATGEPKVSGVLMYVSKASLKQWWVYASPFMKKGYCRRFSGSLASQGPTVALCRISAVAVGCHGIGSLGGFRVEGLRFLRSFCC